MNLDTALDVACQTHIGAIREARRATSYHWIGGPGVGKSQTKRDLCRKLATVLQEPVGLVVEMPANYSDSSMARGFMLPMKGEEGAFDSNWTRPSWYPRRINMIVFEPVRSTPQGGEGRADGIKVWEKGTWTGPIPKVGIVDLDEYGQADLEVRKPLCELVLNGQVGDTSLPTKGWRVMMASNRMSDRSGVIRPLMHEINRRGDFQIDSDPQAWLNWCDRQNGFDKPHDLFRSFAQKNPDVVFRETVPDGTDPYCTPRSLCMLANDLRSLRSQQDIDTNALPMDAVAKEVSRGLIGKVETEKLFIHLKYHESIPEIEDVIRAPMSAKLPTDRASQLICGYILSYHVKDSNAGQIMKYLLRMHPEIQITTVRCITQSASERCLSVVNVPEFQQYVIKNQDVLLASMS